MNEHDRVVVLSARRFDGAIFDLDGVLTDTARLHAAAWKAVFDDFLRRHAERTGASVRPFDAQADYLAHVDGRRREDGVRQFLASRGIRLRERRAVVRPGKNRSYWRHVARRHGADALGCAMPRPCPRTVHPVSKRRAGFAAHQNRPAELHAMTACGLRLQDEEHA